MIASRHFVFSAFCILGLSLPAVAQTQNNSPLVTATQTITTTGVATDTGAANTGAVMNDPTGIDNAPRPVPKRLTAQERWNRMSPEQRSVIINDWQKLDETVRPVFPIYRDSALEQQVQQAGSGTAIAPVTSPVSMTVPTGTTTDNDNIDDSPLVQPANPSGE